MQAYIDHLIEDLKEIGKNPPPRPYYDDYDEVKGIEYVLEWERNPSQRMYDIFGLEPEVFPPSDKLNDAQIVQLTDAILDLWQSHNFYAEIPSTEIPRRRVYEVLTKRMEEDAQYVSEGTLHLEFCHYEPTECPWGIEYCWCKDQDWIKDDDEMDNVDENFVF